MTEADWLTATDPERMLDYHRGKVSDRKLRLFAVACCRAVWHCLTDPRSRRAVEVSEAFTEGLASDDELRYAGWKAEGAYYAQLVRRDQFRQEQRLIALGVVHPDDTAFVSDELTQWINSARAAEHAANDPDEFLTEVSPNLLRPELVLDLFGNPFRPVTFDPRWRSESVVALATGIYADRAFDRMPILADALEEAGCDSADALNHCRGPGPHARGCWVVDLVLGKS
jgi:hypothetical protein